MLGFGPFGGTSFWRECFATMDNTSLSPAVQTCNCIRGLNYLPSLGSHFFPWHHHWIAESLT
jgi:hypothetical protein